jgi:lipid-binding SYLF domain-containing protein
MSFLRGNLVTALFLFLASIFLPTPSIADYYNEPAELVDRGTSVYKGFMVDPNMEWFQRNISQAKGIFIVPQMLRGGFIVGGSGGRGLLLAQDGLTGKWSYPAFYSMGSVSLGFQIGADASEIILLIMTERGLGAMLSTDYKLGGDVSVAAGPVGASAKAQTADILAFGRAQGAFAGISVEGAVISPLVDWNRIYYGKSVQVFDIINNQSVSNKQAEPLRELMPKPGKSTRTLGR